MALSKFSIALAFAIAMASSAALAKPSTDGRVTRYSYTADDTYRVTTRSGAWTQIEFGGDEQVQNTAFSDESWERKLSSTGDLLVKPRHDASENSAIVTTSRRRYALVFRNVRSAAAYDMRVAWTYRDGYVELQPSFVDQPHPARVVPAALPVASAGSAGGEYPPESLFGASDTAPAVENKRQAQSREPVSLPDPSAPPAPIATVDAPVAPLAPLVQVAVAPLAAPPAYEYVAELADVNIRGVLRRWAAQAGWSFLPEHWAVPVDIPLAGTAAFGGNFEEAVRGLLEATELGQAPLAPCLYANRVLRVIPASQLCDRSMFGV